MKGKILSLFLSISLFTGTLGGEGISMLNAVTERGYEAEVVLEKPEGGPETENPKSETGNSESKTKKPEAETGNSKSETENQTGEEPTKDNSEPEEETPDTGKISEEEQEKDHSESEVVKKDSEQKPEEPLKEPDKETESEAPSEESKEKPGEAGKEGESEETKEKESEEGKQTKEKEKKEEQEKDTKEEKRKKQTEEGNTGIQVMEGTTRGADGLIHTIINQNSDKKELKLDAFETLDKGEKREGYTLGKNPSRKVTCTHTAPEICGTIRSNPPQRPLNPTERELKSSVSFTGKLKGKKYTVRTAREDAGGINNTVTHLALYVTPEGCGEQTLAYPYVCPDGYAAYTYSEKHYIQCPNTEAFHVIGSSHVWLGCTKGDIGEILYSLQTFRHEFNVYRFTPNIYEAALDNQGADSTGTKKIYEKYDNGWYLNSGCSQVLSGILDERKITLPKRTGYQFDGYYTSKSGGEKMINKDGTMTAAGKNNYRTSKNATWYARWIPYTLTIRYRANGGIITGTPQQDIGSYANNWNYQTGKKNLVNISSFGLSRIGYNRKDGAEWNTKADGSGKSFDQDVDYAMTDYAPNLTSGNRTVTLYAQWTPKVYTVTLNHQLSSPEAAGTGKIYEKYDTGWYLDQGCTRGLKEIVSPKKTDYIFQGYYTAKNGGTQMISADKELTESGKANNRMAQNATWYAQYKYNIGCEDYADIPCDLEKTNGDIREDFGLRIAYDKDRGTVLADAGKNRAGCTVSLERKPAGTKTGKFTSTLPGASASGITNGEGKAEFSMGPQEGAAYQLRASLAGKAFCDRIVYFKNGRFRTLVKLGVKGKKEAAYGSTLAGSAWGTEDSAYSLYWYDSCTTLANIQKPGTVCRYFTYKDVNMAYSGNGATSGTNTLETDVSLEDAYRFRENGFTRETMEEKETAEEQKYECRVKYRFDGWDMTSMGESAYQENQQEKIEIIYQKAKEKGAVSNSTTEPAGTYQKATPLPTDGTLLTLGGNVKGTQMPAFQTGTKETRGAGRGAAEYINLLAQWNAFPTIVVTPGDSLEFYEGEEVTKEDLISHLTAHDNEDNCNPKENPDLNDKLRIVKIIYPEPENQSQEAYEKTYEKDVPEDFLLDTYYLKLEKDEAVDVLVTFAVTDSSGNTTEEEFPVTIKYNNYPEISSEDIFYYLKEEANRGELTEEAFLNRARADDKEDGDLTGKLELKDFNPGELQQQTEAKAEFSITYQVTDAFRKTTYKTVTVFIWDEDAAIAEMPKYYVRYISEKYLDTLEEHSTWREPENMAYLVSILQNETPMETWEFTHEDVLAVQAWITEGGDGNWKQGREADQEFLTRFAHCKK